MSRRDASLLALVVVGSVLTLTLTSGVASADSTITIDHENDSVTVANASSQVISGTADLPPGTELSVRTRSTGETQPRFIKTESAVVTESGRWGVAFNFSDQSPGDTFLVTVVTEDGSTEAQQSGTVVDCDANCAETPPQNTPTPLPEQTQRSTETGTQSPTVMLDGQAVVVDRGEVAAIHLTYNGVDTATVVLGNESESGYELVATVTDGDGDGRAVLYVDTTLAGRAGRTVSTSGGDSVTVRSETSVDSSLDAGEYDLALHGGTDAVGTPDTVGTLLLQEPDAATTTNDAAFEQATDSGLFGQRTIGLALSGLLVLGGAGVALALLRE